MKRFVVISDTHCHPRSAFATGDGVNNSRLVRTLEVLDASLAKAQELDVPWVFGGDIVHTAGYALNVVLSGITKVLGKYPDVGKLIVWGNHDARGVGGRITFDQTILEALWRAVPEMVVLDPSVEPVTEAGGITFGGVGYQPRADLINFGPPTDVGIYHQTVRGTLTPTGFELTEGIYARDLLHHHRMAIVGHVHHPQQIVTPDVGEGQAILIPGSPEHHDFGDSGDHGWWIVSLPGDEIKNPTVEFVAGGSPQFLTVASPNEIKEDGNFYRVQTVPSGTVLPYHAKVIAPTPTTVKARDILKGASEEQQILQAWMQNEPPEEGWDTQAFMDYGLRLLHGQTTPKRLQPLALHRLHIQNFLSYEDQEFKRVDGVWLVLGQSRDYVSNGAGKSSLFEALYWLLFGKTTKGLTGNDVIRWDQPGVCRVYAEFVWGDKVLYVTRTKGARKSSLDVADDVGEWEAESVTAMTEKLCERLGITPELYRALGYFSQRNLTLFSAATDAERKGMLADLLGLEVYQEAATACAVAATQAEQDNLQVTTRRDTLQGELVTATELERAALARSTEWENQHTNLVHDARERLNALSAGSNETKVAITGQKMWVDEHKQKTEEHAHRVRVEQESLRDTIAAQLREQQSDQGAERGRKLEAEKRELELGLSQALDIPDERGATKEYWEGVVATTHENWEKAQAQYGDANTAAIQTSSALVAAAKALTSIHSRLHDAEATLAGGVCPTCQQAVNEKHRAKCLEPLQREYDTQSTEVGQCERAEIDARERKVETEKMLHRAAEVRGEAMRWLDKAQRLLVVKDQYIQWYESSMALDASIQKQVEQVIEHNIERELRVYEQAIVEGEQRLASMVNDHANAITNARKNLELVEGQQNPHGAGVEETQERCNQLRAQVIECEGELQTVASNLVIAQYWKKGFGKQGIQSLLVEEVATLFNAARGDILPVLTLGVFDVQFSTISTTATGELRERTEFQVYMHGEPVPYNALSGGQQRRVDVGVMLTLVVAVSQWLQVPGVLGIIVLDEVFGFLDASGAEGLVEALRAVQKVIPSVYAVTQNPEMQALFPDTITVQQNAEGISTIL